MKLTVLLLSILFFQAQASVSAQSVTISGKEMDLTQVFTAIKQQTGYVVFYNRTLLEHTRPVSLAVQNMPLPDLLDLLFRNQPLTYTIQDKTIILLRRKEDAATGDKPPARGITVYGRIIDQEGQPLPGISIRIKGGNKGVTSGLGGTFKLEDASDGDELQITAIGYESITLRLVGDKFVILSSGNKAGAKEADKSILIISEAAGFTLRLARATSLLDEVQVVPYGVTSRRFSTGSIGTVKAKDIENQPVMNVLQALEGRVTGLNVSQISGNSAAPMKVEIRGRTSLNNLALTDPLYVIDGVPLNILEVSPLTKSNVSAGFVQGGLTNTRGENPLLFLNPRDIESIDVLKDADATAIYGSRGANGVILITTKKNKQGPTRFSLNVTQGVTTVQRYLDLMNTPEYLAMRREAFRNDRIEPTIYNAQDLMLWDTTAYTDWQRELIGTGSQLNIDARLTGGLAQTSYTFGAGYRGQKELMNNSGKTQNTSFFVSVTHASLNQKLNLNVTSRLSLSDVDAYNVDNLLYIPPNAPSIYTETGEFNFAPWRNQWASLFPFSGLKRPSESNTQVFMNSLTVRYELLRGLTLSATGGYTAGINENASFLPAASYDPAFNAISGAYFGNSVNRSYTVEPQLNYTAGIGKGRLSFQLGGSVQQVLAKSTTRMGRLFPNDHLIRSINNAALVTTMDAQNEYRYAAVFGILNYRWDDKYVLNLNARRDGSSRFGPGKQFGNFGSVGLAWLASEEKWMRNALPQWISFIKLRGSYGITGRDGIGDYEYLSRWSSAYSLGAFSEKVFEYNGVPAFHILRALNQEFQWESTKKLEGGLNIALFNDRVNIEASYYKTRSGNQLTGVPTPLYTGFGTVTANWDAVIDNSGVEVALRANLVQTKDWQVSANFNISHNRNVLADYPGLENSSFASTFEIGKSLNIRYLLRYTGIDPLTGNYSFEDHNKDGIITMGNTPIPNTLEDDRYMVIDLNPRYFGGFGTTVNYKGIGLHAHFVYKKQVGGDPFLTLSLGGMNNGILPNEVAEHHWTGPGDNALYPRYTTLNDIDWSRMAASDGGFTDASFVKLNTLALSWDIPAKYTKMAKMQSCRLSIQTQNLFTITSYKGIGPEVQNLNHASPIPRVVTANLSFNF